MSIPESIPFTAIVLAGERSTRHPLLEKFGVCCKALIEVGGVAMLKRVLDTLTTSSQVGHLVLTGPDKRKLEDNPLLQQIINAANAQWTPPEAGPSKSACTAMKSVPANQAVLLTTADHALLSAEIVDDFCNQARNRKLDAVVGLAPYAVVHAAYPDMKKTVLRFRDNEYCGCNLFAFLTPQGRKVAEFWQQVEQQRKNPLKVMQSLGWLAVIRYALGLLTLDQALEKLSRKLDLKLGAIILPYADAAVDVDSISDYEIIQKKLESRL